MTLSIQLKQFLLGSKQPFLLVHPVQVPQVCVLQPSHVLHLILACRWSGVLGKCTFGDKVSSDSLLLTLFSARRRSIVSLLRLVSASFMGFGRGDLYMFVLGSSSPPF